MARQTVAPQALLSMEFSKQEYWSGLPSPPPGDLPYSGTKPASLTSPAGFFTISATWETQRCTIADFKLTRVLILHPSSSPPFCGNSVFSHPQASSSSLELQRKSGSPEPSHLLHSEGTPPALTHWAQTGALLPRRHLAVGKALLLSELESSFVNQG